MLHRIGNACAGILLLALGAAACGDDSAGGDMPDAGMTDPGADAGSGESATAFVVTGDYISSGVVSTIAIPSREVTTNAVAGVAGSDPVVRQFGDRVYIINRRGVNITDNITILDATSYELVAQISTGTGSNPYDVAVQGSTLYVAALGAPGILVLDSELPQASVKQTIDLSELDVDDGIPDCNALHLEGTTLIVTCQVLDPAAGFAPRGPGKVAVIDTADNSVSSTFELTTPNPFGRLIKSSPTSPLNGDLLIGTVEFGTNAGCIERIAVAPTPASAGCLVSNDILGGYATAYQHSSDETMYIAVTTGFDDKGKALGHVASYDLVEDMLALTPVTPPEQQIVDLTRCPTGHWVFADAAGGMRVYDQSGKELSPTMLLDVVHPPFVGNVVCY